LAGDRFVIGRGEGCNLRSNSDAVSRQHCAITIAQSQVSVRDLGSRNGTFVNDQQIEGDQPLKSGDKLVIGPLQFELMISEIESDVKSDVKKAPDDQPVVVAPGSGGGGGSSNKWDEDAVSQWLDEADAAERAQRLTEPDTRVFKFGDTVAIEGASQQDAKDKKKGAAEKKKPGKLPPKRDNSKDSQEAAAQMLRRLFNRG
jgi:pSer/pThr/pTyr-binding forkhead associated (FHA) protein